MVFAREPAICRLDVVCGRSRSEAKNSVEVRHYFHPPEGALPGTSHRPGSCSSSEACSSRFEPGIFTVILLLVIVRLKGLALFAQKSEECSRGRLSCVWVSNRRLRPSWSDARESMRYWRGRWLLRERRLHRAVQERFSFPATPGPFLELAASRRAHSRQEPT
jgi:hypothetical protein